MGFLEVLTLIFVVCKLTDIIEWSWWLVLAPELFAIVVYALLVIFQVGFIATIWNSFRKDVFK